MLSCAPTRPRASRLGKRLGSYNRTTADTHTCAVLGEGAERSVVIASLRTIIEMREK